MSGKDIPVGIDLGTTNSLIGAVVEGKARLFADASGNELLPSVVGGGPSGELYIGRAGKNRRLLDPEGTVVSVKRRMGTDVRLKMGTKELSPPQVSALILGALLDRAEAALGARPTRAVITVPAYFGDAQRQATRDAGEMAGLRVERLVNEPTAAALTYQTGAEELVMVYDLGGGTFDVSVLERDEGLLEVRASRGDTHLGGDDLDRALAELVLRRLGAARAAVERDPRALTRIYEAVERAKIALSDREEIRLFDPFLTGEGEAVHLDLALTRADVEEAARPFVIRTLTHVDAALHDAGVKPGDVHRVLLVGGSSKMPLVRRMAAAHLGRPVHVDLDADRAVALGASLLAGRLGGAEVDEVLVDITPHTLAVGVLDVGALDEGGVVDLAAAPVIPRDTVVPVERTRTVFTVVPDQVAADLPIVQGEHPRLAGNTPLGKVRVEPLPPGPALSPVEVTFKLDLSGVLHVRAVHVRSGRAAEAHITESPYGLTEQHRRRAGVEVEQIRAAAPEAAAGPSDHDLSLARALVGRAAKALEKEGGDEAGRARVEAAAEALEEAIAARSAEVMDRGDALADALLDLI